MGITIGMLLAREGYSRFVGRIGGKREYKSDYDLIDTLAQFELFTTGVVFWSQFADTIWKSMNNAAKTGIAWSEGGAKEKFYKALEQTGESVERVIPGLDALKGGYEAFADKKGVSITGKLLEWTTGIPAKRFGEGEYERTVADAVRRALLQTEKYPEATKSKGGGGIRKPRAPQGVK